MKKMWIAVCASAVLMLLSAGFSAAADMTYTGEIMDSQCAKMGSHAMMMKKEGIATAKECTMGCVKAGGKYVLYNSAKKMTYQLDDQTKPEAFAGDKVKVMGTLDKATHTIHVTEIKAAS
jgi:hypothetical protein